MQETDDAVVAVDAPTSAGAPIVYFDGSCPLCTAEINHYAARAPKHTLCLIDISADGAELGPDLCADAAMRRFHMRKPNGVLVSGAEAFVEIWKVVPGWTWASRVARLPGALSFLELTYRAFLRIRPLVAWCARRLGMKAANPHQKRHGK